MIEQKVVDKTIDGIIKSEGGFVNDAADRGGATKYGITLETLRQVPGHENATANDVKNLDVSVAKKIYAVKYATPYMKLSNPIVFNFIVNGAVQHGVSGMNKLIQRTLGVAEDGVLGPNTWGKLLVTEASPTQFLAAIVATRCEYYARIIQSNPTQLKFARGWLNRIAKDLR